MLVYKPYEYIKTIKNDIDCDGNRKYIRNLYVKQRY